MKRSQAGFTLIEMMVVVAIISILAALFIGVSQRPYGINAKNAAQAVASEVAFAKLRSNATRRVQRVQIEPHRVSVWSAPAIGLIAPTSGTWELADTRTFPKRVTVASVVPGAQTSTGQSVTVNDTLLAYIDIRPDGQATSSTAYITDGRDNWRVLVYHITGGAYARQGW